MKTKRMFFSLEWMKQKLQDHYKDYIFFTNESGRSNIVCFHDGTKTERVMLLKRIGEFLKRLSTC